MTGTTITTATEVTTTRVRFPGADGDVLVGDLHRPVGVADPTPGLVVTGSWTTVKEQMAGLYARRLAAAGLTTLAFDFTGFGQSEGTPRDTEDPSRKARDVGAAFAYLATRDDVVDPDRLGGLGVCASAGYQAMNAVTDGRVASLGLVAPWLHDPQLVEPIYGGAEGVADLREQAARARAHHEATGEVRYVPAISEDDPVAAMTGPFGYYLDAERGAIPEWGARFAVMAWEPWLTLDAVSVGSSVEQPVEMIHSRDGAVPDGAEGFHARLPRPAGPIRWVAGTQLDFYDQPEQVDAAVDAMVDHFGSTL